MPFWFDGVVVGLDDDFDAVVVVVDADFQLAPVDFVVVLLDLPPPPNCVDWTMISDSFV